MQRGNGRNLALNVRLGYGMGNLSFGVVMQLVTSYLMFYSTNILGIPGRWVGLAASFGVVWDAIIDPVLGHITDNAVFKRFGRRHLFMLIGAVGATVVNLWLWSIDSSLSAISKYILLAVLLLLLRTFASMFAVPYNALGTELTYNYYERTSVQSFKTAFFVLGLVMPTVGGSLLFFRPTADYAVGMLNPNAYSYMGAIGSIVMLSTGIYCIISTWKYRTFAKKAPKLFRPKRMLLSFLTTFRNKDFRFVALGYLLVNFASAWVGALALHTFTFAFGYSNNMIALVFGVMFGCAILSQPLWVTLSKRLEKRPALLMAVACGILGSFALLLLVVIAPGRLRANWYTMMPIIALVGLGMGGMLSLPPSMVSDLAEIQVAKTGRHMEGLMFGNFTLCYQLSQSISVLLLGVLLDVIRFNSSLSVQTPETLYWLGVLLPLGCLVGFGAGFWAYSRYSLTLEKISEARRKIASLRELNGGSSN